jgi:hypothetical protein
MGTKTKTPRRKKQARRSGSQLLVLMTLEERELIDAGAKAAGLPTGGWLRSLGLGAAKKLASR